MSRVGQFKEAEVKGEHGTYRRGRMGTLDFILANPLEKGRDAIAVILAYLRPIFPNLELMILTGICGGIPSATTGQELRFGAVVIDVIQHYAGGQASDRRQMEQDFEGCCVAWAHSLISALETDDKYFKAQMMDFLKQLQRAAPSKYKYPGDKYDRLYEADHPHLCERCRVIPNPASCKCMGYWV